MRSSLEEIIYFASLFQEKVNLRHFLMFYFLSLEQVKIQPVARYDWEQKYYYGNLIAVSNSYLAYAIRGEIPSCLGCDYILLFCVFLKEATFTSEKGNWQ